MSTQEVPLIEPKRGDLMCIEGRNFKLPSPEWLENPAFGKKELDEQSKRKLIGLLEADKKNKRKDIYSRWFACYIYHVSANVVDDLIGYIRTAVFACDAKVSRHLTGEINKLYRVPNTRQSTYIGIREDFILPSVLKDITWLSKVPKDCMDYSKELIRHFCNDVTNDMRGLADDIDEDKKCRDDQYDAFDWSSANVGKVSDISSSKLR